MFSIHANDLRNKGLDKKVIMLEVSKNQHFRHLRNNNYNEITNELPQAAALLSLSSCV